MLSLQQTRPIWASNPLGPRICRWWAARPSFSFNRLTADEAKVIISFQHGFALFPRLQNDGWLNRKLSGAESAITHPRRWLTHQCVVHKWYGGGTSPETITDGPPRELFVITSSSPADRRTDTAIKFSYHPVPSGLLQQWGASHRLFGKTNSGVGSAVSSTLWASFML